MSAPVTITETEYFIVAKETPLNAPRVPYVWWHERSSDREKLEALMDGDPSNREGFRIVRVDSTHVVTPLESPNALQSGEGGADDH